MWGAHAMALCALGLVCQVFWSEGREIVVASALMLLFVLGRAPVDRGFAAAVAPVALAWAGDRLDGVPRVWLALALVAYGAGQVWRPFRFKGTMPRDARTPAAPKPLKGRLVLGKIALRRTEDDLGGSR